ncbi:MAG TPA: hypothetical protein VHM30_02110, partial [Gemmatimonadaceae bacterium]|nr:hypothetical protein [Gemmatimonadaceae bacterium]
MTAETKGANLPARPQAAEMGYTARDQAFPRSMYLDAEGKFHRDLNPRELVAAVQQGTGELWVDVDSTNR